MHRKKIWFLIIGASLMINQFGCASIKETSKCVAGVSTNVLEEGRKKALKKNFKEGLESCYKKAKDALVQTSSYIYAQPVGKELIAVYLSEKDTTPVGIFFTRIDADNTQVEVSSPSTYAKETVATRVFNAIEGLPIPMPVSEEEGEI